MKRGWKIAAIAGVISAAVIGGGFAWYQYGHSSSEPVYVYNMDIVGMTQFWGDTRESYGPVSTDRIQTVFLTETQEVTEILVAEGDEVKKGDLLMTFDTTLSDIALERKELEVRRIQLNLEDARTELQRINSMRPMVVPKPKPVPVGDPIPAEFVIGNDSSFDGSSAEKAIVCWIAGETSIRNGILEQIRSMAETLQNENRLYEEEEEEEPAQGEETETPETEPEPIVVTDFYTVFKVTAGDMSLGGRMTWQGLHVFKSEGGFVFKFFDASGVPDYTQPEIETEMPEMNSGYTAAQIAQLREEQKKTIEDLEFQLKMCEAEYTIMQKEISDGNVYAETDGVVVSLLEPEEALMMQQPVLKVSGGGGFIVEGKVSELERDSMTIGMEVTINDWESGGMYTGQVSSVRDFPVNDRYGYGMGNPNASYYPFTVFVDESANLRAGGYVSIQYSSAGAENGLYLRTPFVRTEKGRSYVYVMGADGRLEERTVTVGKNVWGSYLEILSGLNADEMVAFPYGKNVKSGAKTAQGDYSTLYD